ncbi:unnamed protein product [Darwinula stevensoni]|uniref:Grh/CP2 DB domain-containing protein n=1 Tax=Darwinula stevensoni TaxID=69355 RepID=A0A7R9A4S7_9CRUS|nr:unnamed protein product [Darwinula stevensoni]CAG0883984.1 unnamed protein product [Darwinula stevensoni]
MRAVNQPECSVLDSVNEAAGEANVNAVGGGEGAVEPEEEAWKSYYEHHEHPLTAATSAMLNINGANDEGSSNSPTAPIFYEPYYKVPIEKANVSGGKQLSEMWPIPAFSPGVGSRVTLTTGPKLLNGTASGVSETELHSLLVSGGAGSPLIKREPEDLRSSKSGKSSTSPIDVKSEPHREDGSPDLGAVYTSAAYGHPYPETAAALVHYNNSVSVNSSRPSPYSLSTSDHYYREYYNAQNAAGEVYTLRPYEAGDVSAAGVGASSGSAFVDRYLRTPQGGYKSPGHVLSVDLPSPDSGIGAEAVTPREHNAIHQTFDYSELVSGGLMAGGPGTDGVLPGIRGPGNANNQGANRSRAWHDFGRQSEADKVHIPKIFSPVGFKYYLETPISTSQRREDDRVTYINKGQFYGVTLEYIPDPENPLKSQTVKSLVVLVFREEKSAEDEIKAWQFWHGRQHSIKQRILDIDTKNSLGLVGCIEEVAHNAIAVYWNPLESPAKINIAVQCLSTDFSSQKGVKGLPLHLQIDTYDEPSKSGPVCHRGYCQIKVFCDKGAERKTRDEERRAAKRKLTATGRKKLDELYHPPCERSEFYSMSDLTKPPSLFTPADDVDKLASMELQSFYSQAASDDSSHSSDKKVILTDGLGGAGPEATPVMAEHLPPPVGTCAIPMKRLKMIPPVTERLMLYVRQDGERVYTPLHLTPPSLVGLLNAIQDKYKVAVSTVKHIFRKNRKGILAKVDDEMLKHYCNEDVFTIFIEKAESEDTYEITLREDMGAT